MKALVFNVGSTTLKFACIDTSTCDRLTEGLIDRIGQSGGDAPDHLSAAIEVMNQHRPIKLDVIAHRIVQGGAVFRSPTLVDGDVLQSLRNLDEMAPLHNPSARSVVEAITDLALPIPQVLIFDTAFFSTLPAEAYRYAIPETIYETYGIRRYGAHGTSHHFVTEKALDHLSIDDPKRRPQIRIVSLHLGGGASATASVGGVAIETSMGMTPLEGLVMATRCGDIDPSVPLHLIRRAGMSVDDVDRLLNKSSGLLGLCGEADMRRVLKRREDGDAAATLAIDIYVHRLIKTIGGYVALMSGVDAIVFTAGVGENSAEIRQLVTQPLSHLGIAIDTRRNADVRRGEAVMDVSADDATARTLVVPTDEELAIAYQATRLLL